MLFDTTIRAVLEYWPHLLISTIAIHLVRNKFHHGLHKYPGHPLAGWTNWWRVFDALSRSPEQTQLALHRRYGDIVRLGPNLISFADPRAIKTIYGLNKGMVKSNFYIVQQATRNGRRLKSLFSTTDEAYHARYRRCISNAFAMASLLEYEPLVDQTIETFMTRTRQYYSDANEPCNFARWLQLFAFDVIGEITWSKRLGFVDTNTDVDGIIGFVADFFSYAAPVGQMPWLDLLLHKNLLKMQLQRWGLNQTVFPITLFALEQAKDRAAEMEQIVKYGVAEGIPGRGRDLLTKFTRAQYDHREFMTDTQVLSSCISMIIAGSESTAVGLSSIFYYLLRNPRTYKKLMDEIDAATRQGSIAQRNEKRVSWTESRKLPYLDAVIQESLRVHPPPGVVLERVVPPAGIDILGEYIPGGTLVGCNAWVLHRRPEVFGQDVDEFRPERWLEANTEQLQAMKATMFQFGAGARTCIGKHVSLLEIYKLVPTFLRNFEISLERPDQEWRTFNAFFVKPLDFRVHFKPRDAVPQGA